MAIQANMVPKNEWPKDNSHDNKKGSEKGV
jgi:hypothetical protein